MTDILNEAPAPAPVLFGRKMYISSGTSKLRLFEERQLSKSADCSLQDALEAIEDQFYLLHRQLGRLLAKAESGRWDNEE